MDKLKQALLRFGADASNWETSVDSALDTLNRLIEEDTENKYSDTVIDNITSSLSRGPKGGRRTEVVKKIVLESDWTIAAKLYGQPKTKKVVAPTNSSSSSSSSNTEHNNDDEDDNDTEEGDHSDSDETIDDDDLSFEIKAPPLGNLVNADNNPGISVHFEKTLANMTHKYYKPCAEELGITEEQFRNTYEPKPKKRILPELVSAASSSSGTVVTTPPPNPAGPSTPKAPKKAKPNSSSEVFGADEGTLVASKKQSGKARASASSNGVSSEADEGTPVKVRASALSSGSASSSEIYLQTGCVLILNVETFNYLKTELKDWEKQERKSDEKVKTTSNKGIYIQDGVSKETGWIIVCDTHLFPQAVAVAKAFSAAKAVTSTQS